MVGIVRGQRVARNRDSRQPTRLLQVELLKGEDDRTIEMFCPMDYNPAPGTRVDIVDVSGSYQIAIGFSDGLTPEVDPGEYEIYSTDNPATTKKARLKLNSAGEIILNQGTDFAVAFNELKIAFDQLKLDFDTFASTHSHPVPGVTPGGATVVASVTVHIPSTANIDPAKVDEVRI